MPARAFSSAASLTSVPKICASRVRGGRRTLQEEDRNRIHFFARRTARHPDSDRLSRVPRPAQGRKDPEPQRLVGIRISKKLSDPDQEILLEHDRRPDRRRARHSTPRGSLIPRNAIRRTGRRHNVLRL